MSVKRILTAPSRALSFLRVSLTMTANCRGCCWNTFCKVSTRLSIQSNTVLNTLILLLLEKTTFLRATFLHLRCGINIFTEAGLVIMREHFMLDTLCFLHKINMQSHQMLKEQLHIFALFIWIWLLSKSSCWALTSLNCNWAQILFCEPLSDEVLLPCSCWSASASFCPPRWCSAERAIATTWWSHPTEPEPCSPAPRFPVQNLPCEHTQINTEGQWAQIFNPKLSIVCASMCVDVCMCFIPSLFLNPLGKKMSDFYGEGCGGVEVVDCVIGHVGYKLANATPLGHDPTGLHKTEQKGFMCNSSMLKHLLIKVCEHWDCHERVDWIQPLMDFIDLDDWESSQTLRDLVSDIMNYIWHTQHLNQSLCFTT